MGRRCYTARHYIKDSYGQDKLGVSASRDGESVNCRLDFSTNSDALLAIVGRVEIVALKTMLEEILEDWR